MYPSRTDRKKAEDQEKLARQRRFWAVLNIALIVVAAAMLMYHFSSREEEQADLSAPRQLALEVSVPGVYGLDHPPAAG